VKKTVLSVPRLVVSPAAVAITREGNESTSMTLRFVCQAVVHIIPGTAVAGGI
jgi:hypothetical protein